MPIAKASATDFADDSAWIAAKARSALGMVFRAVGLETAERDDYLIVSARSIGVAVRVNDRVEVENGHLIAAEFQISVDDVHIPQFAAGVVGWEKTPEGARQAAASDWAMLCGAPVGFAIATQLGGNGPPSSGDPIAPCYQRGVVGGSVFFRSIVALRGTAKISGMPASEELISRVATIALDNLNRTKRAGEYRSATILFAVEGTTITGGECRLDGLASPELLTDLARLSWPQGDPSYMYKLYLVFPPTD